MSARRTTPYLVATAVAVLWSHGARAQHVPIGSTLSPSQGDPTAAPGTSPPLPSPTLLPTLGRPKDKGADAPGPDPWSSRKKAVSVVGGAPGSPTGVVGLSFEYAPIKYLVLGAGGGWAPDGGGRVAFMPRLRLPLSRRFALGLGTPFATGPYQYTAGLNEQCDFAGCAAGYRTTRTWTMAVWMHVEPNFEIRVGPAVALRLYGGRGFVLNTESDRCISTLAAGCPSRQGEQKWYGGLALGYAW